MTKCPRRISGTVPNDRRYCGRAMLSFCILDWSVVRFMPRRAAAYLGPPMIHLVSWRVRRIWPHSTSSSVRCLLAGVFSSHFNSLSGTCSVDRGRLTGSLGRAREREGCPLRFSIADPINHACRIVRDQQGAIRHNQEINRAPPCLLALKPSFCEHRIAEVSLAIS